MGVPGYMSKRGYQGFDIPTPIGARYFPPDPKFDEETDKALPIALGYKSNGGRPAYRQRVYNAAKKGGIRASKAMGFSRQDLEDLGQSAYDGPGWTVRKH